MKVQTFFEKFSLFADAPDAVAKLRQLVRQLAVTGKLVDQDPNDEPAEHALRSCGVDLTRWKVTTEEQRLPVPDSWTWIRFAGVGEQRLGKMLDAEKNRGELKPYLRNTNVQWMRFELSDVKAMRVEESEEGELRLKYGDLLICEGGEPGRCAIWRDQVAEMYFQKAIHRVRPCNAVMSEFLAMNLQLDCENAVLQDYFTGATIKHLTGRSLAAYPVPIPPLAEQKRIVAKVDELMALCDRLEAQQQEREMRHAALARAALARFADAPTPANLDLLFHKSYSIPPADLRKSILTLAVQGKLVTHDPQDGAARELIDRAMKKREQTIRSKNLRRKQLDESAELFSPDELPSSWCIERLANLVDPENSISYGVLVPGNDVPDGVPFVRAQDLSLWNHSARPNKTIAPEIEKPYARTRLTGGEILLCVVGSIGKLGVAPESWAGANIARAVARIKPIPDIARDYLLIVLQETAVQTFFTSSTRTLAQPTLNVGLIEQTPIPVPPLAEQRRIVGKVHELMALVDALETQLATARSAGAALLEAVIHELLNPTVEIIPFPSSERESLPDRAAIGCYAIQRLAEKRTFGRTAEVKVLYLAEAHLGLDLGGRYLREAAGPLDQWIYKFEEDAARLQWFSVVEGQTKDGHKKVEYHAGPMLSAKAQEVSTRLSAAQRSEFDRLLELLAQKPTVEVEIIATLFAAWNDFLINGRQPSDDEIVREVRENWHPSKQRFKEPELKTWLAWLRQHALVPQGRGPHTVGQQGRLQLH